MASFIHANPNMQSTEEDLSSFEEDSPTPELLRLETLLNNIAESEQSIHNRSLASALVRLWDQEYNYDLTRWTKMQLAWQFVNNLQSPYSTDSDLADLRYPEGLMLKQQVLGTIMAGLDSSDRWWEAKTTVPSKVPYIHLIRDLVNDHQGNMMEEMTTALESGVICGQCVMMVGVKVGSTLQVGQGPPASEQEPNPFQLFVKAPEGSSKPFVPNESIPRLHFKAIPADCFVLDSSREKMFQMWQAEYPVGLIFSQCERMGFDKEALLRAKGGGATYTTSEISRVGYARRGMVRGKRAGTTILLTFLEGTLYDVETGAILFENKYVVMANNREIIYGPSDTPWWDGGFSLVTAPFIPVAFDPYGRGVISENIDVLRARYTVTNLMMDYVTEALSGAFEFDEEQIKDNFLRKNFKIRPRMMIPVVESQGRPVIRRIQIASETSNSAWQALQALDQRGQATTGISDSGGSPQPRTRSTAMEKKMRAADHGNSWRLVYKGLERNFLSAVLRYSCTRLVQCYPEDLWKKYVMKKCEQILLRSPELDEQGKATWKAAYEKVANMPPEERFQELCSDIEFTARPFSASFERQDRVEKTAFLIRQVQPAGMMDYINKAELMKDMVEAMDYDSERIVVKQLIGPPSTGNGQFEDDDGIDVTGGLLQGMPGMGLPNHQNFGGVFPGGPSQQVPNLMNPPEPKEG